MTAAIDGGRVVESAGKNTIQEPADAVMLSTNGEAITAGAFKKMLVAGESRFGSNSTMEKLAAELTLVQGQQANNPTVLLQETPEVTIPDVLPVELVLLNEKVIPSLTVQSAPVSIEQPKLLLKDIDFIGTDNFIEVQTGVEDSVPPVIDSAINGVLTDGKNVISAQYVNPLLPEGVVDSKVSVPITTPNVNALAEVDLVEVDLVDGVTQVTALYDSDSFDKSLQSKAAPSAELSKMALPLADVSAVRAGVGNNNNTVGRESAAPIAADATTDEQAIVGNRQSPIQVAPSKVAGIENVIPGIQNENQRLLQTPTPPALEASVSPTSINPLSDPTASMRAATNSVAGTRAHTFEGLSQTAGNTIKMMMEQGSSRATVQLNPPELGSMRINIDLKADQLNVQITVSQTNTRDALESASPRLRAQLEADGYVGVNIDFNGGQQAGHGGFENKNSNDTGFDYGLDADTEQSDATDNISLLTTKASSSLVDLFA